MEEYIARNPCFATDLFDINLTSILFEVEMTVSGVLGAPDFSSRIGESAVSPSYTYKYFIEDMKCKE